jgi:hypothetical protein
MCIVSFSFVWVYVLFEWKSIPCMLKHYIDITAGDPIIKSDKIFMDNTHYPMYFLCRPLICYEKKT